MPDPLVIQTLNEWRLKLAMREAAQMQAMVRQWMAVEDRLRAQMQDLAMYLQEQQTMGEIITEARLMQMDRYQSLIAQARVEQAKYSNLTALDVAAAQRGALRDGIVMAQDSIMAAGMDAGIRNLVFDRINVGAVDYLIGFASDGTPLYNLLAASYPDSVLTLTSQLVEGLATGAGPRTTARIMADGMAGNLDRALTIARTEQLRALRTSNLAQMDQSNVVDGYIRRAQRSGNVCPACLSLDGQEYETMEEAQFESHPNCSCFASPILKYGGTPAFPSGPEWFDTLPEKQQRSMLGAGRFGLYQDGNLDWGRVATIQNNPVWGKTVQQTPLGDLRASPPS